MAVAYDTSVIIGGNGANAVTFPAITTAATNELLVCFIHYSNATPTGVTFTGGTGLTWTILQTRIASGGSSTNGYVECYYALAASVQSAQAITATFTGGGSPQSSAILAAFSGQDTTGTNGSGAIGALAGPSGTTANPSQAITTTRTNSLVIAGWGETSNGAFTAGTGQTNTSTATAAPGIYSAAVIEYQNAVTAASGTAVTMNETLAAAPWAAHVFEIKAPVAVVSSVNSSAFMAFF